MQTFVRILAAILLPGILGACAPEKKISAGFDVRGEAPAGEYVGGNWTPESVALECHGPHCRPQVGVLVASRRISPARIELFRCTASLIGPDRVLTSGHCAFEGREAHFILKSGVRRVTGVEWKTYTAAQGDHKVALAPDLAVLKLATPFDDVTPLRVATGARPTYQSLNATVVNAGSEPGNFRIDALTCTVRRHENIFPFNVGDNPDLIFGFDCGVIPGNSGGPMFAEGEEVQAVLQATVDPVANAAKLPDPKAPWALHQIGIATNARCFPLTGGAAARCVAVTVDKINARAQATRTSRWNSISSLGNTERATFPTESTVVQQRLRQRIEGKEAIVTLDNPTCIRAGVGELTELKFLTELVVIETDAWARTNSRVIDRRVDVGRVIARDRDVYRIEIKWSAPFGEMEDPKQHSSVLRGSPFDIALPRCAR